MKSFLITFLLALSVNAATVNLACFNKNAIGPLPLFISLDTTNGAVLTAKNQTCNMQSIPYNPRSSKYNGWIRTGASSPFCQNLGAVIFNPSRISHQGIHIYWVSYSPETQAGKEGWVQLGYENDADPGAGAEAKSMLRCFPPRK